MRAPSLTVAAAQPVCRALDVSGNGEAHAQVVRAVQARVVVFPELSLTGYELDAAPVACDHDVLTPIIDACAATGSLALVGAPVEEHGRRFIAMLAVGGAAARPAYRKTWLGGNEPTHFRPGDGRTVLEVDGWRLGLGICGDTGATQHVAGIAALNVDAYLAGRYTSRRSSQSKRPGPSSSPAPAGRSSSSPASTARRVTSSPRRQEGRRSTRRKALPSPAPDRTKEASSGPPSRETVPPQGRSAGTRVGTFPPP